MAGLARTATPQSAVKGVEVEAQIAPRERPELEGPVERTAVAVVAEAQDRTA